MQALKKQLQLTQGEKEKLGQLTEHRTKDGRVYALGGLHYIPWASL